MYLFFFRQLGNSQQEAVVFIQIRFSQYHGSVRLNDGIRTMHEGVYCCQATGVTFLKGFILNTNRYDNQFHRKKCHIL